MFTIYEGLIFGTKYNGINLHGLKTTKVLPRVQKFCSYITTTFLCISITNVPIKICHNTDPHQNPILEGVCVTTYFDWTARY